MKGKKLPDVWALLTPRVDPKDGYRLGGTYVTRDDARKLRKTWETIVRYTPAKPAKVCRWVRDEDSTFSTGCDRLGLNIHGLYCQKCGGKIKVKR